MKFAFTFPHTYNDETFLFNLQSKNLVCFRNVALASFRRTFRTSSATYQLSHVYSYKSFKYLRGTPIKKELTEHYTRFSLVSKACKAVKITMYVTLRTSDVVLNITKIHQHTTHKIELKFYQYFKNYIKSLLILVDYKIVFSKRYYLSTLLRSM